MSPMPQYPSVINVPCSLQVTVRTAPRSMRHKMFSLGKIRSWRLKICPESGESKLEIGVKVARSKNP